MCLGSVQTSRTCNLIRTNDYRKYCSMEMNGLDHASSDSSLSGRLNRRWDLVLQFVCSDYYLFVSQLSKLLPAVLHPSDHSSTLLYLGQPKKILLRETRAASISPACLESQQRRIEPRDPPPGGKTRTERRLYLLIICFIRK